MISIIITAFKESKSIGKAIESLLKQKINGKYEIIVLAPDNETIDVIKSYAKKHKQIKSLKDEGKGKPSALNLAFKKAKGNILILTDGDVFVSKDSISKLVRHFKDNKIGGVCAKVVSINPTNNLFGYWAYLLTESFHKLRLKNHINNRNIICSGYLYAIRRGIIKEIPRDILADDAFISLSTIKKGYRTIYEQKAKVYVKYPLNLIDWIKQKKRTAARFYQLKSYFNISKISSLKEELFILPEIILEVRTLKQIFWFIFLIVMKCYIWFRILFDFKLWRRSFKKIWQRVESTK